MQRGNWEIKLKSDIKWFNSINDVGIQFPMENTSLLKAMFLKNAFMEKKVVHHLDVDLRDVPLADIHTDKLGINAVLIDVYFHGIHHELPIYYSYAWDDGVITFNIEYEVDDEDERDMNTAVPWRITASIVTTDKKILTEFNTVFGGWKYRTPKTNKGKIFSLISLKNGLSYASVGTAKLPLIEDNYTDGVVSDIEYIIENLQCKTPVGRIIIFSGEPGTGKTHLIRSIMEEVQKATFIIIPPGMVSSLTGPELMSFFIQYKAHFLSPIVLVIEDADMCLTERASDNMSLISGLLNISDGIVGNLMDVRIIATTNVEMKDIDSAILRPGRLLKKVNLTKLSAGKATNVYRRLVDKWDAPAIEKPMTLAEVYFKAKESGELKVESVKQPIGFNSFRTEYITMDEEI